MQRKYRVSGALFPKTAPNGPVYSGVIEIDGVKTQISIWEKTSAAGQPYLQISEDKKKGQGAAPQSQAFSGGAQAFTKQAQQKPQSSHNDDMDSDEIPF